MGDEDKPKFKKESKKNNQLEVALNNQIGKLKKVSPQEVKPKKETPFKTSLNNEINKINQRKEIKLMGGALVDNILNSSLNNEVNRRNEIDLMEKAEEEMKKLIKKEKKE